MSTPIRQLVLSLFFAFLILSGPFSFAIGPGVGAQSLQSCGSCAGVGLSGDLGEDDGAAGLDLGYPVDIPAPIAKGIEGIDASSLSFAEFGGSNLTWGTKVLIKNAATDVIGTISGQLQNPSVDKTVGVAINGSFADTFQTSGGRFSFQVTEGNVDIPMAFVVLSTETSSSENGIPPALMKAATATTYASYPVILKIINVNGSYKMQISLTNESAQSGAALRKMRIAFSGEGDLAFSASDTDSFPFIGITPYQGGSYEVEVSGLTTAAEELLFGGDILYGVYAETHAIFQANDDDTLTTISDALSEYSGRTVQISPNGQWLATQTINTGSLTRVIKLINLESLVSFSIVPNGETDAVTELSFTWVSDGVLAVIKKQSNYTLQIYDFTDEDLDSIEDSGTLTLTAQDVYTSTTRLANPVSNPTANTDDTTIVAYECVANGIDNLCYDDVATNEHQVYFDADFDYNVSHVSWAPNTGCILFEGTPTTASSDAETLIGMIDSREDNFSFLTRGLRPTVYETGAGNAFVVGYLSYLSETLQASIVNMSENCNIEEESDPDADTVGPSVISVYPVDMADGVLLDTEIYAEISEPFEDVTVDITTENTTLDLIERTAWNIGSLNNAIYSTGSRDLCPLSSYRVVLSSDLKDESENSMDSSSSWIFTTADASFSSTDTQFQSSNSATAQPRVALNESGYGIAAYVYDYDTDGFDDIVGVLLNIYGANGTAQLISTGTNTSNVSNPDVAVDSSGTIFVVWQESSKIYANRYNRTQGTWSGAMQLSNSADTASDPQVAANSAGHAVATWRGLGTDVRTDVHYSLYSSGWGAEVDKVDDLAENTSPAFEPQVVFIAENQADFIIAWYQNNGNGTFSARARTYINGVAENLITTFAAAEVGDASLVRLASDMNGTANIAMKKYVNTSSLYGVRSYRFSGGSWDTATPTNHSTSITASDYRVSITMNQNADAVISWSSATDNIQEAALRLNTDSVWRGTNNLKYASNTIATNGQDLFIDYQGNVIATWIPGDGQIWINRFTMNGFAWSGAAPLDATNGRQEVVLSGTPCGQAIFVYDSLNGSTHTIRGRMFQ